MSSLLQLRFLGVGNAAAHELGNAAAVLEDADGRPLLLIDCGPTVLPAYVARYDRGREQRATATPPRRLTFEGDRPADCSGR